MKRHLSVAAVAEQLLMHRKTVLGLIHAGELPAVNVGGEGNGARYRISVADLDRWLASRKVAA